MPSKHLTIILSKLSEPKIVTSIEEFDKVWKEYGTFSMDEEQLAVVENYFEVSEGKPLLFLPEKDVSKYRHMLEPFFTREELDALD